jgi:hypothetical protein
MLGATVIAATWLCSLQWGPSRSLNKWTQQTMI